MFPIMMSSMPGEIDVLVHGGVAVVAPTGEVDMARAPVLRLALERALASGANAVRVDLTGVTFLDSTGLSGLVGAWRQATRRHIGFRLTNPAPNVRRVLDITNLDRLLDEC